ncbi:MAG TPA: hypothetical protein PLN21_20045 [Gemmatales bacterium]|nr:hypothetical protein [Gemmatales bacterium]
MPLRQDVYVYNESNGIILTCKNLGGRKPFEQQSAAWKKAIAGGEVVALELAQDDSFVVRVVLDDPLSAAEESQWVDVHTFKLHLPQDGLAICGGSEYLEDPDSDDSAEFVQFVDIPAGAYLARWYTFVTSPNYQVRKSSWPLPAELTDGRRYVDFLLRLVPFTDHADLVKTDAEGWVPSRKPTRKLDTAPAGIIAENPSGWTPSAEEPKKPSVPHRAQMKIIARPPGDAPEWVRDAWIGLVLPMAVELLPEAASTKAKSQEVIRFAVYAHEAMAILAAAQPKAAEWWKQKFPAAFTSKTLIFDFAREVCELVNR